VSPKQQNLSGRPETGGLAAGGRECFMQTLNVPATVDDGGTKHFEAA
jgi:hypothetical protein